MSPENYINEIGTPWEETVRELFDEFLVNSNPLQDLDTDDIDRIFLQKEIRDVLDIIEAINSGTASIEDLINYPLDYLSDVSGAQEWIDSVVSEYNKYFNPEEDIILGDPGVIEPEVQPDVGTIIGPVTIPSPFIPDLPEEDEGGGGGSQAAPAPTRPTQPSTPTTQTPQDETVEEPQAGDVFFEVIDGIVYRRDYETGELVREDKVPPYMQGAGDGVYDDAGQPLEDDETPFIVPIVTTTPNVPSQAAPDVVSDSELFGEDPFGDTTAEGGTGDGTGAGEGSGSGNGSGDGDGDGNGNTPVEQTKRKAFGEDFEPVMFGLSYQPLVVPEIMSMPQRDYVGELNNIINRSLFEGII